MTSDDRAFAIPSDEVLVGLITRARNRDERFLDALKIMLKRRVHQAIIETPFESGQAAPETGAFLGR